MTAVAPAIARSGRVSLYRLATMMIATAIFFVAWLSWRPFEQLFTLSDACFLAGLVLLTLAGRLPLAPFGSLTGPWYLCVAVMLGGLLASSMAGPDPGRWLVVALQYGFATLLLPMLLVQHGGPVLQRFALALILGVAAMQLFGAFVYFAFADMSFWSLRAVFGHDFITGGRRLGAFVGDANWNAAIVGMSLPFVVHLMGVKLLPTVTGLALFGTLGLGIILSGSFTGFTSSMLALLIYALVARLYPGWRVLIISGILVAAYLLAGGPLPEAFAARVAPALANQNLDQAGTFLGRWELITEAWEMTGKTSLVGLGVDQFRVVSMHGAPVHNMFLLIWTEGGLPALAGWLGLLMIQVAIACVALGYDRRAAGLSIAVMTVFLIQSTASPHMYARLWLVPVMIAAGFAMAATQGPAAAARRD